MTAYTGVVCVPAPSVVKCSKVADRLGSRVWGGNGRAERIKWLFQYGRDSTARRKRDLMLGTPVNQAGEPSILFGVWVDDSVGFA